MLTAVVASLALASVAVGCGEAFEAEEPQVKKKGGGADSGAEVAEVGDKLSLKGTTYKVTGATTAGSVGDGFLEEQADGEFVIVELSLTNDKDEPATIFGDNLRLLGGNDKEYSVSTEASIAVGGDAVLLLEEIQPEVTKKGTLIYDVPKKAVSGSRLQVEDLFSGSTGEIDLGL